MSTAEQAAVAVCDEAIGALRVLDADRLEGLEQRATSVALELRALGSLDGRPGLPEVAARLRLLGAVVRATGDNLRVLRGNAGAAGELPWVR